jgi:hypothetical protein
MYLIASFLVFCVFALNVALGASSGGSSYLGDVGEMLVLFVAAALFVVGILQKEAARKSKSDS